VVDQSGNVDGRPNALLEAMAAGCAVVASNVAGVPLAVQSGENGLLVPQKDPGRLAEAVSTLLGDAALRAEMGAAARRKIEQELNWPHIARMFESIYRAASARRTRRRSRR
jgi:glycosyltransferase involved in cell wall biosynthesis